MRALLMAVALVLPLPGLPESPPLAEIPYGVTVEAPAERGTTVQVEPTQPPPDTEPEPSPYAPPGLNNCDEMHFYRVQAGLPARFDAIGWRESNCRNEDGVHTSCCYGYWQLNVALHMKDHRLAPRYRACGVDSYTDVNSDTPEDKRRQACAAKALYDVVGLSAWAATR
jgi:hypothetical protein